MPQDDGSPDPIQGLSGAVALRRQTSEGYNELPEPDRRTRLRIIIDVVREPMLALLLCAGAIYLALGDLKDALVLIAFATLSVVITVVQESRTERVLESLRDLSSPRALVIRDGKHLRIAGRDVVRGDMIVLTEGDRVPADARLVESRNLQIDESLLTGESVPVRKLAHVGGPTPDAPRPGGDDLPYVFSGSLVVRGMGIAEVNAIGLRSEVGKIGHALSKLETEPPRLRAETTRLVQIFAAIGGAVSVLAVILYGTFRGGWLDAVLTGIALGMSMLPEEFPVVLTVFMAMGAWRISRANVLTRRAATIETLGSATVLCTDKTGTLTENRMTIAELRLDDSQIFRPRETAVGLPKEFYPLLEFGVLACDQEASDPMDKAFHVLARERLSGTERLQGQDWKLHHSYGLRPGLLAVSQVWQSSDGYVIAAKGAPEAIADLCHLKPEDAAGLTRSAEAMARGGLRVLGVARARSTDADMPGTQHDFAFEFLGLVGLSDPLRASVPAAVGDCRSAGIKVVMITGDYPATARAIAREAGLDADDIVSGEDLETLSDLDLASRVRTATVFARIMPEQKLRIVNAFKANGEIVAMTGDGVNDAPSLKAAHIGIAMGGRGTDVAREASSIVLLDDDFGSIVKSIRLGRRIYDNLHKAMGFIFAVHVPIAGMALLPLFFGLPILFAPVHIAFLEMIIDPVCSLVFEAETEEGDLMRRPPRTATASLFSVSSIVWSAFQGAVAFVLVAAIFVVALDRGMPEAEVRALTFFSLVLSIVSLIFVNRSFSASLSTAIRQPNPALIWVFPTVAAMLGVTLLWPFASDLFRFGPLHVNDLALTAGAGVGVLVILEMMKLFYLKRQI